MQQFEKDKKVLISFKGESFGYYLNDEYVGTHGFKAGYLVGNQHITLVENGHKGETYGHIIDNELVLKDGTKLQLEKE